MTKERRTKNRTQKKEKKEARSTKHEIGETSSLRGRDCER
jgi:hypothetical protein